MVKGKRALGVVVATAAIAATMAVAGCSASDANQGGGGETASIKSVSSQAFVDIDGAKTQAVIVEYSDDVDASSVSAADFEVTDYATYTYGAQGAEGFERGDGAAAGTVTKAYVNDERATSDKGGVDAGKYVVLEVNTDYMLAGNTPAYTATAMVGVRQTGELSSKGKVVQASSDEVKNYTIEDVERTKPNGEKETKTVITADADSIILPELTGGDSWKIGEKFAAVDCFSEYTGEKSDFDLLYSIYVPQLSDVDKGHVALALHILDAGSLGEDPMLTLTESQAPVDWASDSVQSQQKTIVVCPQVSEEQRSSNDYVATSEINTALWELMDYLVNDSDYADYIDTNRIYGTGQSMGGMTLMDMAAQRDNYFAGFMISGSQWSNCYNKDVASEGQVARTPETDSRTFAGDYASDPNFENWYYQISDDNILIFNCEGDAMSHGLWEYANKYFSANGAALNTAMIEPDGNVSAGDGVIENLVSNAGATAINWITFKGGSHMSTWKYSYEFTEGFKWLLQQTRDSEMSRAKVEGLNAEYNGTTGDGFTGGTKGMNSALFGISGPSEVYPEGWTPESVQTYLAAHPDANKKNGPTGK